MSIMQDSLLPKPEKLSGSPELCGVIDGYRRYVGQRYFRVLMLHSRGGLTGAWSNISDHCITEVMLAELLEEMLGLPPEQADVLCRSALAHDWNKRMEVTGSGETAEQHFAKDHADVDWELVEVTHPQSIDRIEQRLVSPHLSSEELLFYIDNICMGSEIVTPQGRRDDLVQRGRLLPDAADRELDATLRIEQKIHAAREKQGLSVRVGEQLSGVLVKEYMRRLIQSAVERQFGNRREIDGKFPSIVATVEDQRRGDPEKNEDALFVSVPGEPIVVGVFDGATAIEPIPEYFQHISMTPGTLASSIAVGSMKATPSTTPEGALRYINTAMSVAACCMKVPEADRSRLFSTIGIVGMLDSVSKTMRCARVGDGFAVHMKPDGTCMWHIDKRTARMETGEITKAVEISRREHRPMREMLNHPEVVAMIKRNRLSENAPDGSACGSIKGSDAQNLEQYIDTFAIVCDTGDRIFLFSDGLLISPLMTDEQREIIEDALRVGGIEGALFAIRAHQQADPDMVRFPRLKQCDDATGVEIAIP